MKINYPKEDIHTFSVDEILTLFNTNVATGITQQEAENRAKEFGANTYEAQKQKSIWLILLEQFNIYDMQKGYF